MLDAWISIFFSFHLPLVYVSTHDLCSTRRSHLIIPRDRAENIFSKHTSFIFPEKFQEQLTICGLYIFTIHIPNITSVFSCSNILINLMHRILFKVIPMLKTLRINTCLIFQWIISKWIKDTTQLVSFYILLLEDLWHPFNHRFTSVITLITFTLNPSHPKRIEPLTHIWYNMSWQHRTG